MTEPLPSPAVTAIAKYPMPGQVKLAVSVCSNRPMEPRCALAFGMMLHYLTAFQVPFGVITRMQASLLPQARQECLDEAVADGCSHQLWWDDDIEPPADCALRMLHAMKLNPEIDVLAANYARKQETLHYTCEGLDGEECVSADRQGVEEIDKCGMGLMMVKLDNIRKTRAPHFEVVWNAEHRKYQGEDRYFTKKLREAGLRIFVDHGISNWVQHWKSVGVHFGMFKDGREAMTDEQVHRANDGHGE